MNAPRLGAPLRARIYGGGCPVLPPSAASLDLVDAVRAVVSDAFGGAPETAHQRFDVAGFFVALTQARAALVHDRAVLGAARGVLRELGVDEGAFNVDRPRLRGIAPGGHRHPATRDVYAPHRDTWYANPRAQINLWIPLRRVSTRDGLALYPCALRRLLPNDSARFDYADFAARGGFQSGRADSDAAYPRLLGEPPLPALVPAVVRGGRLLFSAAQLHGPMPHDEPETRFSVDLRLVSRVDQRMGRGAPQVDSASRGDASLGYALRVPAHEPHEGSA